MRACGRAVFLADHHTSNGRTLRGALVVYACKGADTRPDDASPRIPDGVGQGRGEAPPFESHPPGLVV